ncbi:hypothetical protein [Nostoc sp. PA-18-2419]|uniref:hypothetical protein n=1 Tax=Nostoc sp. PA-18-2419 TaxID=2575443 RepID=UPI003982F178
MKLWAWALVTVVATLSTRLWLGGVLKLAGRDYRRQTHSALSTRLWLGGVLKPLRFKP